MKGAGAIARILKAEGVDHLFCFPSNAIIDAAAELEIRPVMARTERTVVGMADGYTRVTNGRRIGVCAVQYGPGAENSFGGVAQAYSDSTPILALPGGFPQHRLGVEPTFDAALNYQHVTKWAARINQVERIPDFMRRAFTFLRMGRPGPVLLEVPADVASAELDEAAFAYSPVRPARTMADPADVEAAVGALIAAGQPLIHAGLGVLYAQAWDELRELAELIQAPVMTTLPGKGAFPEDHPLSLGSGGLAGPRPVAHYLEQSDLILGVGASLTASVFAAPIPRGKVVIQVAVNEGNVNKDYSIAHPVLGDAKLVLRQMIEETRRRLGPEGRRGDDRVARRVRAAREEWLGEWMPKLTSEEVPINPYRVIWDVQRAVDPRNTIATHDAGSPRDQMAPFWCAPVPNSYIGWGKSTHLGYGLALALGAKLAAPEKTVLNIMGDGAFGMIGMEVETAVRNRLGTLTILMNNSCLGAHRKDLAAATSRYGTRFLTGDYCKVAEGLGAYSERVVEPGEIIPAVRRALKFTAEGRPAVLEVITKEELAFSRYW